MSDARDILAAVDLPGPARQLLRAGDDRRLIAELGAHYEQYHANLQARLKDLPGIGQSLSDPTGPALGGSLKGLSDALTKFQRQGRLLQDIQDAERMLRRAAELAPTNAAVASVDEIYRAELPLPLIGPTGELLSGEEATAEAQRLNSGTALLEPTLSPMDAVRRLQGE